MPAEMICLLVFWSAGCAVTGAAAGLAWTAAHVLELTGLLVAAQAENRRLREELACHVGAMRAVADAGQLGQTGHPPTLIHEVLIAREEVAGVATDR